MAIKIKSSRHVVHHVNCMVYGESGIGKTTLLATAPKPLIISIEGGLLTLANKDVPVIEVHSFKEIDEVHSWLLKSKEADKFDTICTDSMSEEAELILAEEMQKTRDGRQAYGTMADIMAYSIRGFRDLPKHTVFTAKVRKIVDDASGAIKFYPSVPGQQLLNNLPYFFDEVFRMDFGTTKKTADKPAQQYRYIDTVGNRQYICKDRSGKLNAKEPADLTRIFNKILQLEPAKTQKANSNTNANANANAKKPQEGKKNGTTPKAS